MGVRRVLRARRFIYWFIFSDGGCESGDGIV